MGQRRAVVVGCRTHYNVRAEPREITAALNSSKWKQYNVMLAMKTKDCEGLVL